MNVLVLAPHPDDEAIACGGALCLHADKGDRVTVVFLTSGELGLKDLGRDEVRQIREAEARAAAEILGVRDLAFLRCTDSQVGAELSNATALLQPILERERPQLIYLPHAQEWHPDHKAAAELAQCVPESAELLFYEIWTPIQQPQHIIDITAVWDRKLAAVRAHASQMTQWPYERAVQGLNQYRAAMSGRAGYAEAYLKDL